MLHAVETPPAEAALLRRFNVLLDRLFERLCDPLTTPAIVTAAWVTGVWYELSPAWVNEVCIRVRSGRSALTLMRTVTRATAAQKAELLTTLRSQRGAAAAYGVGSTYRPLPHPALPDNANLKKRVRELLKRFYDPEFDPGFGVPDAADPALPRMTRPAFVAAFCDHNDIGVCPYCDGPLTRSLAKLDHVLPKDTFPFLAIDPENLVPACTDCNSVQVKGGKVPLTAPPANAAEDWFHPYHRSADGHVTITFRPPRRGNMPRRIALTNADPAIQRRVEGLNGLFGLERHWGERLPHEFDALVKLLRKRKRKGKAASVEDFLDFAFDAAEAAVRSRGYSLLNLAVCCASISGDPQFRAELNAVFASA